MNLSARRSIILAFLCGLGVVGIGLFFLIQEITDDPGDPRLRQFVHKRPPVPIVFTSRKLPASLRPTPTAGEFYSQPGPRYWDGGEGRLRLLRPDGRVVELTWQKPLPDGGTLIDVMAPSVSPDGRRIVFAGRRADAQNGSGFRIYECGIDGSGLRQITGLETDPGCSALPPLRFALDGRKLADDERKRLDYDDIDPIRMADDLLLFASTRSPDYGSALPRRATQIWRLEKEATQPTPLTANRFNDRWPFATAEGFVIFSLWSRNREVVTADLTELQPITDRPHATEPADNWMAAGLQPSGEFFSGVVKIPDSVWRPRPLFNGRLAFMSPKNPRDTSGDELGILRIGQAEPGTMKHSSSSIPTGAEQPATTEGVQWHSGIVEGRHFSLATPSLCPPNLVVVTGAPLNDAQTPPIATNYALYLLPQDGWPQGAKAELVFDDPEFVDAEPVAVYPRGMTPSPTTPPTATGGRPIPLADGSTYTGPTGRIENADVYKESEHGHMPGRSTIDGKLVLEAPPRGTMAKIRFYAAGRDRFDDPDVPRVPGRWSKLLEVPVQENGRIEADVPTPAPTVLVGLDHENKILRWRTAAKDKQGRQGTFLAVAGDHYSGVKPNGYHFCVGCHVGHSTDPKLQIREPIPK